MTFDAHKNFAYSLVATAPSPASSGTSLVVTAADGTKFPAVPFNATIWPTGVQPTTANAEIVRVIARSTDTLKITRAQEWSSARTVVAGDQIAATITAKTATDLEAGLSPDLPVANRAPAHDQLISAATSAYVASDYEIVYSSVANATVSGLGERDFNTSTQYLAQSFTTGAVEGIVSSVDLWLRTASGAGSPTDGLTIELRLDNGGVPGSFVLGSGTIASASIPTPNRDYVSCFLTAVLSPNTVYHLVGHRVGATDLVNYSSWGGDASSTYAGGQVLNSSDSGASWTPRAAEDFGFKINFAYVLELAADGILEIG